MRALWSALSALALATFACGGAVESSGGGGGGASSSGGGGSSGGSVTGDGGMGGAGMGDDGGPGSPGSDGGGAYGTCTSTSGSNTHYTDGGCGPAFEFGECGGDKLEVDCECPNDHGFCDCRVNGKVINMVTYDCSACAVPNDQWVSCGFPSR